jgi:hypothetical protein
MTVLANDGGQPCHTGDVAEKGAEPSGLPSLGNYPFGRQLRVVNNNFAAVAVDAPDITDNGSNPLGQDT